MLDGLLIAVYIFVSIGYIIEIYNLFKYGDDKHTNICLWTANGGGSIFAYVYCFENNYNELSILFIIHYSLCFLCLSINLYFVYSKNFLRTYEINEKNDSMDQQIDLENQDTIMKTSFEIDMNPKIMWTNPLYSKNLHEKSLSI
jgi:hypothetical protein